MSIFKAIKIVLNNSIFLFQIKFFLVIPQWIELKNNITKINYQYSYRNLKKGDLKLGLISSTFFTLVRILKEKILQKKYFHKKLFSLKNCFERFLQKKYFHLKTIFFEELF